MIFKKLEACILKNYPYIFATREEENQDKVKCIAIYSLFFNDKIWVDPSVIKKEGIRKFMKTLKEMNKRRIAEWALKHHSNVQQGWLEKYQLAVKAHDAKEMVDSEFEQEHHNMMQQSGLQLCIVHSIMD